MIYLDTSIALAQLLGETRRPPDALWSEPLVSSRLLQYELWSRLNAKGLAGSHGELARQLVGMVALVELAVPVLERALDPFPVPVRTLDALHLATAVFLLGQDQDVRLATYDEHLAHAATALDIPLWQDSAR
ncbi:MAG TPA: PIN domain-containing protein [Polyangiaceae bacterium]